jgi:hypothetical protein
MSHQPTILFPWVSRVYYHTPMFSLWELVAMVKYTQILRFAGISRSMWYRWKLRHQQPFERRPAVGWGRCMRAWNYYCRKLLLRFWWWTQSKTFQEHDVCTQHPRHRAGWLPVALQCLSRPKSPLSVIGPWQFVHILYWKGHLQSLTKATQNSRVWSTTIDPLPAAFASRVFGC